MHAQARSQRFIFGFSLFSLLPTSQPLVCPDSTSHPALLLPPYPLPIVSLLWTGTSAHSSQLSSQHL